LNCIEDHEGHEIICNGAKNELLQANSGNGVRTVAIVTRIKEQQEVELGRFQAPLNLERQSQVH